MDNKLVKRFAAAVVSALVVLTPLIGFAQGKGKVNDASIVKAVEDFITNPYGFFEMLIWPDTDSKLKIWWIVFITIPLTGVWLWMLAREPERRKWLNNLAVFVTFGMAAFFVLRLFVLPFFGMLARFIGLISVAFGFFSDPSIDGFIGLVEVFISSIGFLIGLWILKTLGLFAIIERWVNLGKDLAGRLWRGHERFKDKPTLFWVLVGGLLVTGVVNGKFSMHVTEKLPPFVAYPGIIPICSAVAGIVCLLWMTKRGRKLSEGALSRFVTQKPDSTGGGPCINYGRRAKYDKAAWAQGRQVPIPDPKTHQTAYEEVTCGHYNAKGVESCGDDQCDHRNPWRSWDCPNCGEKGLSYDTLKCPKCPTPKPMDPWCCVKCGYWPNGRGIPWTTPACPQCGASRPKYPTSPFRQPWEKTKKAAPGSWICQWQIIQKNAAGQVIPEREANGKAKVVNGVPVLLKLPCGMENAKGTANCSFCGAPNPNPPPPAPAPAPGAAPAAPASARTCSACGKELGPQAKLACNHCGAFFTAAPPVVPAPAAPAPVASAAPAAPAAPAPAAPAIDEESPGLDIWKLSL